MSTVRSLPLKRPYEFQSMNNSFMTGIQRVASAAVNVSWTSFSKVCLAPMFEANCFSGAFGCCCRICATQMAYSRSSHKWGGIVEDMHTIMSYDTHTKSKKALSWEPDLVGCPYSLYCLLEPPAFQKLMARDQGH